MTTRLDAQSAKAMASHTDHARLAAATDAQLTAAALADPDNPPLDEAFFAKARRMRLEDFLPAGKQKVCLRLDSDVLAWFRAHRKKGYQTAINAALRAFIADQENSASR
ncbi:BrnA antitoxin family protein [Solidesulfovibrio sp.]